MTTLIFGVGAGLYLILSLWVLGVLIAVISLRAEKNIGAYAILFVIAFTIILVSLPRASEDPAAAENKTYDGLLVWRIVLLALLVVSFVLSLVSCIKFGWAEPIRPFRISDWVF